MSSRFPTIVFMSVFLNLSRHMAQATTSRFLQTTTAFISSPRTLKREQYFHELSHRQNIGLHADKNSNDNEKDFEPTWTYVPYDPSKPKIRKSHHQQQQRRFSSWNVPKTVDIPEDRLDISFVRSSGAGGQNVNKVNTKVEVRMNVKEADWIPSEVRERLRTQQANRINKDGILSLTAQEYRTQGQNRKAALTKLQQMILEAWPRPKVRKVRKGITKAAKARNKEFKKRRSETKENRKRVDW